jgi:RNase H-fold protein (predicted Holliday junction resolvase)
MMDNQRLVINTILGLDPGRDKCGLAVMKNKQVVEHQIVDSTGAIALVQQLCQNYEIDLMVIGDGTTSQAWQQKITSSLATPLPIVTVDEKNSTLEARDRYWLMYPPQGLQRLIPSGLRVPPRPVDDLVAILLIERYLAI